jgi:hypothetical protein
MKAQAGLVRECHLGIIFITLQNSYRHTFVNIVSILDFNASTDSPYPNTYL